MNSVLKLRSHEAECARQDLIAVRHQLRRQQEILEGAEEALRLAVDARRTGATGQPSLARLEAYRQAAHDQVRAERRKLDRLRDLEEEARLLLMMRKGAEETMRHLEEGERASYWKRIRSVEAEQLDEQAITGFHRQRRAASP